MDGQRSTGDPTPGSAPGAGGDGAAPLDEAERLDALLAHAGELLRGELVEAADLEVAEALRIAPGDARALNLLGLVRFRAGRYAEAHQVYLDLCDSDPADTALRLNLGLVELRMGDNLAAAASLRQVVSREPQNFKAQGYLGLALLRAGELMQAREAFLAAGQGDMVRQVDEQLSAVPRPIGSLFPGVARAEDQITRQQPEVRDSTPRAARSTWPSPAPELSAYRASAAGDEDDAEAGPGEPAAGRPVAAAPSPHAEGAAPQPLGGFLAASEAHLRADEPLGVTRDGLLVVQVEGRLHMRTTGAIASSGRLAYAPLSRKLRGRAGDEPFGEGDEAMVIASGSGRVLLGARGGRFTALHLGDADDVLYLAEAVVFAFEESLAWENGRVPGGGAAGLQIVSLRGQGRVALRTRRAPVTLRIGQGEVFYVDQSALLGWTGQVVPQQLRGSDGEPTQFVACSGEGAVILEEPRPDAPPDPPR